MPEPIRKMVELPAGYRSTAVARYLWQLDDQTRRLVEATRDLTPAALEWQHAPGVNSIGMLLAHIAVAEIHVTAVVLEGRAHSDVSGVIGIRIEDDGLPLPPDGRPPAALAGQGIAYFHGMLERARENTRRVAIGLEDRDLGREVVRHPAEGTTRLYNLEWGLYHLVEHLAGHHAQILLLKHLYQTARAGV